MKRITTYVNDEQFLGLQEYVKDKRTTVYAVLKVALFEYLERHP